MAAQRPAVRGVSGVSDRFWRGTPMLVTLLVVTLALAAALAALLVRNHDSSAAGGVGSLATQHAPDRPALIAITAGLTARALSYDYRTLNRDMARAEAGMSPRFGKQYRTTMSKIRAQTQSARVRLKATVAGTSLISADEHAAQALVFVDQVTTRAGSRRQRLDQNRVVVTLIRGGGHWRISKMDAF